MNISSLMRTAEAETGLFRTHRPADLGVAGGLIYLFLVIGGRKGWRMTR